MDDIKKILVGINWPTNDNQKEDIPNRDDFRKTIVSAINNNSEFGPIGIRISGLQIFEKSNETLMGLELSLPNSDQNPGFNDTYADGSVKPTGQVVTPGNARATSPATSPGNTDTYTPVNSDETKIYTEKALNEKTPILAIRNRNPLNLRPGGPTWNGQIGVGRGFVQFESFEMGLRANYINMATKYRHGKTTIAKLVTVWAPETENPTGEYITSVTEYTGEGRNTKINFYDSGFMAKLATAMARVEAGPWRVNDAEFLKFATQVYSKYSERIQKNLS